MPIETTIIAAAPAVLPLAVRSAQIGFELHQAPKEIGDLLKTVKATRKDVSRAQQRRIVLAKRGSRNLDVYDDAITEVERALAGLEILVERARIDLEHNDGKIRCSTKWLWYLRDAKSRSVAFDRLVLAYVRPPFTALLQLEEEQIQPDNRELRKEAPPPYADHHDSTKTSLAVLRKAASQNLLRPKASSISIVRSCDDVNTSDVQLQSSVDDHQLLEDTGKLQPVFPGRLLPHRSVSAPQTIPAHTDTPPTLSHLQSQNRKRPLLYQCSLAQRAASNPNVSTGQSSSSDPFSQSLEQHTSAREQSSANTLGTPSIPQKHFDTSRNISREDDVRQHARQRSDSRSPLSHVETGGLSGKSHFTQAGSLSQRSQTPHDFSTWSRR